MKKQIVVAIAVAAMVCLAQANTLFTSNFDGHTGVPTTEYIRDSSGSPIAGVSWVRNSSVISISDLTAITGGGGFINQGVAFSNGDNLKLNYNLSNGASQGYSLTFTVGTSLSLRTLNIISAQTSGVGSAKNTVHDIMYVLSGGTLGSAVTNATTVSYAGVDWVNTDFDLTGTTIGAGTYTLSVTANNLVGLGAYAAFDGITLEDDLSGLVTTIITNFPTSTLAENPNPGGVLPSTGVSNSNAKGQSFSLPASASLDGFVFEVGLVTQSGDYTLEIYRAMDGLPWMLQPTLSCEGTLPAGLAAGDLIQIDLPASLEVQRGSYVVSLFGTGSTDIKLNYVVDPSYTHGTISKNTFDANGWKPFNATNETCFVFAALGTLDAPLPDAPASAPNLIFIMADDLGWTDVQGGDTGPNVLNGVNYGSDFYQTPNIARIASEGLSFTHCFSHPNCSPTRAAILSGQYAPRSGNGVYHVYHLNRPANSEIPTSFIPPAQRTDIPASHVISAEVLKAGGYVTAHFGKYHVGGSNGGAATMPEKQGFDFNFGGSSKGGPGKYHAENQIFFSSIGQGMNAYAKNYNNTYINDILTPVANGNDPSVLDGKAKHVEDGLGDAAIAFMEEVRKGSMSHRPFYLQLHNYAVHDPTGEEHSRMDLLTKYGTVPDGAIHEDNSYAAIVENMDQTVGRVLNYLDDPNGDGDTSDSIATNTLVIYTSDNGGHIGRTNNDPLRHRKGSFYNGGIRVPLIARQLGTIPEGTQTDTLVHSVDFYPTLIERAGLSMPSGITYDGTSFASHMQNPTNPRDREPIYYHFPGYLDERARPCEVIIKRVDGKDYKLIYTYDPDYTGNPSDLEDIEEGLDVLSTPWELYRYSDDVSETENLLNGSYSNWLLFGDIAQTMAAELSAWLNQGSQDWDAKKVKDRNTNMEVDYLESSSPPPVSPSPDEEFKITDFSTVSNGTEVTITFNSEAGFSYQIQTSSDLETWELFQEILATASDPVEVVLEGGSTKRFYRVVLLK